MASCTLPITTSPGRLALFYEHVTRSLRHKISWHFIAGVNLTDVPDLRTEAERLADLLGEALTSSFRITDWAIEVPNGGIYYQEPLPAIVIGTLSPAAGAADWASTTITFVGTGQAPAPGVCHGRSISRLFIGNSYLFTPTQKTFNFGTHPEMLAFIQTGLNGSTYLPADVYGQQANASVVCPVQYNAAAQRKWGT